MGVLAEDSSQIHIVEYMDIAPKEMASFLYANTGLYCMSLSFLEKAATLSLPLHRVQKTIRWDGGEKEVCKYERFLFDAFGISKKTGALVAPKSSCFAPLKRLKGKDGVASVRKACPCGESA
jgi:UDP-N-acetylglucosamine/UDP-N-acetylgalactosamine diphosphorylase